MKFPQNVTEYIRDMIPFCVTSQALWGVRIVSMVTANVICCRLTAAAQNATTHPAPNLKIFFLTKEPKHKGNGGRDGETRCTFYTIIKKLSALAITFTLAFSEEVRRNRLRLFSFPWDLDKYYRIGSDSSNGKTLHWHSREVLSFRNDSIKKVHAV